MDESFQSEGTRCPSSRIDTRESSSLTGSRGSTFAFFCDMSPAGTVVSIACLLMGHDDMLVRAPGRLWLRCNDCGRETPGWSVGLVIAPIPSERRRPATGTTETRAAA